MPRAKKIRKSGAASGPPLRLSGGFPRAEFYSGLAAFAALALLFYVSPIDFDVSRYFYGEGKNPWPGQNSMPWEWFYRYGQFPATATGILGGLVCLWGFLVPSKKHLRGPGLFLFMMLLFGPGLLVNGLGKALAGRPRPSEVLDFGGFWEFHRVFGFGIPGRGKSFLSGHAASAWYWLCLGFLAPRGQRLWLFISAGLYGLLMSYARVSQGGHFVSDTLLVAPLFFSLAAGLSPLIQWQPKAEFFKRHAWAFALGLAAWVSISNPIYEERNLSWVIWGQPGKADNALERVYSWGVPGVTEPAAYNLLCQVKTGEIRVDFDGKLGPSHRLPFRVEERFIASSLTAVKEAFEPQPLTSSPGWPLEPQGLNLALIQRVSGLFWDGRGQVKIHVPAEKPCELRLKSEGSGITIGTLPENCQVLLYGHFPASALPQGFEAYGKDGFHKGSQGPLIVLKLEGPKITFEQGKQ